jgi:hypothetical protein
LLELFTPTFSSQKFEEAVIKLLLSQAFYAFAWDISG